MSRCNKHPLISLKIDARNITTWSEWSSLVTVVVTEAALMLSPQQSSPHWHNVMSPLLSLSLSPCPGFHRYTLDGLWLHLTFIYIWARFYKEALSTLYHLEEVFDNTYSYFHAQWCNVDVYWVTLFSQSDCPQIPRVLDECAVPASDCRVISPHFPPLSTPPATTKVADLRP